MISLEIKNEIDGIIREKFGIEYSSPIPEKPKNIEYGELFSDVAFKLAPIIKKSPIEIAEKIKEGIKDFKVDNINGFLNFKIPTHIAIRKIKEMKERKIELLKGKFLVEYLSANPTGPLHIGHGRIFAIGETISNIIQFLGGEVRREYYINDAGEQIKKLGRAILDIKEGREPEEYKGEYIYELKNIEGENEYEIGYKASKVILEKIKKTIERMGGRFDSWISEREITQKYLPEIYEKIKNWIYENEGAKFLKTTEFGDDKDRVIIKSNGEGTYFLSDIAYHYFKAKRGFDNIINVWGADHHGYIKRISASLKILGFKGNFKVILVQMVNLLKDGKPYQMSKREGTYITLDELIDEIGEDAVKFIYLTKSPDQHLNIDIDQLKKQNEENPVWYVQYSHARICSLFEEAKKRGYLEEYEREKIEIEREIEIDEEERRILANSLTFFDELMLLSKTMEPHRITQYLIFISSLYHSFYQNKRILVEDRKIRNGRLFVSEIVKDTIKIGLSLLGVSAPKKM